MLVATSTSPQRSTSSDARDSTANTIAAMPPFMSHAPRPYSRPSRTCAVNGSLVHAPRGSAETTSMWPFKTSERPAPRPGLVAMS